MLINTQTALLNSLRFGGKDILELSSETLPPEFQWRWYDRVRDPNRP